MRITKYYDRSWRTWVAFLVDDEGNQASDAQFAATKKEINALKESDFVLYN